MKRETTVILMASVAALGGAALALRYRKTDGSETLVDDLAEISVSASKVPVPSQTAPVQPAIVAKLPNASDPISVRQNNPGNLRSWPGVEVKGGYANFPTPLAGMRATFINLHTYMTKHGITNIRGIISRWAPQEDDNPTSAYIAYVAKSAKVSADQRVSYLTHARAIVRAIGEFEAGRKAWSEALLEQGYVAAGKS